MNKKQIITGIGIVVIFQILILIAEYANAVYPLYTGKEVILNTIPVDPRSMFRGNYVQLNYEISEIKGADINAERGPRNGEVVYVILEVNDQGIYEYKGASLRKPDQGVFIRGRIQNFYGMNREKEYDVTYGIEALFAPKEKALDLEKKLRKKGVATIMIAENGKAALKDVVGKEEYLHSKMLLNEK